MVLELILHSLIVLRQILASCDHLDLMQCGTFCSTMHQLLAQVAIGRTE